MYLTSESSPHQSGMSRLSGGLLNLESSALTLLLCNSMSDQNNCNKNPAASHNSTLVTLPTPLPSPIGPVSEVVRQPCCCQMRVLS